MSVVVDLDGPRPSWFRGDGADWRAFAESLKRAVERIETERASRPEGRRCEDCGADVSALHPSTRFCFDCAARRNRESMRRRRERLKAAAAGRGGAKPDGA